MKARHLSRTLIGSAVLASALGLWTPMSHAQSTCTRHVEINGIQYLRNTCNKEITLVHCGVQPTGNSSLDCDRRKLGMAGVQPGGAVMVGDRLGSYRRVYWLECPDGGTPSNTGWNGSAITGNCR